MRYLAKILGCFLGRRALFCVASYKAKVTLNLWIATPFFKKRLAMTNAKSPKTKHLKISKKHNALKNAFCKQKDELKLR